MSSTNYPGSPGLDAAIVRTIKYLEHHYNTTLTPDERNAWNTHLTTYPPKDIHGRIYSHTATLNPGVIRVSLARQYCWSQSAAVFWFDAEPKLEPTDHFPNPGSVVIDNPSAANFLITITAPAEKQPNTLCQVYIQKPSPYPIASAVRAAAYCLSLFVSGIPTNLDLTPYLPTLFQPKPQHWTSAAVLFLNDDFCPSPSAWTNPIEITE